MESPDAVAPSDEGRDRRNWLRASDVVDIFVYTVVLGLFVEFFPQVISESFTLVLLTAVLLKLVLEVVVRLKGLLLTRIKSARTAWRRSINVATLLLVLPASKFLVIELTALVFQGSVSLGGFWAVTGLIVVLMLARGGVRWMLVRI
ncbi:hypothetical protein [Humibacter ginsenosidimutans]|uniref:Uncharacterized protein n=1 Tax=Humibacter ginsenosidimutans TaxID=2599293 RepID=A0A5B8M9J4_9MICO|nr:hypothetical protein [Humibacter ginsenosidimutans]QDZ16120.1 hypothetical protein FPZ11_16335 [Humibacter ginsenosidimutans]